MKKKMAKLFYYYGTLETFLQNYNQRFIHALMKVTIWNMALKLSEENEIALYTLFL